MGPKPSPRHSLERKDVNGNYDPENCRWATQTEQCRNKRTNHILIFCGEEMPLVEFCIRIGAEGSHARYHLAKGRSSEEVARRIGKAQAHIDLG
jgi:hypothetical protein